MLYRRSGASQKLHGHATGVISHIPRVWNVPQSSCLPDVLRLSLLKPFNSGEPYCPSKAYTNKFNSRSQSTAFLTASSHSCEARACTTRVYHLFEQRTFTGKKDQRTSVYGLNSCVSLHSLVWHRTSEQTRRMFAFPGHSMFSEPWGATQQSLRFPDATFGMPWGCDTAEGFYSPHTGAPRRPSRRTSPDQACSRPVPGVQGLPR
jgi:hypothetical protein